MQNFRVKKGEWQDTIPLFEDFLRVYSDKELSFAIELKVDGAEQEVADLLHQYGVDKRTIVTSFNLDRLRVIKAYAPYLHIGYLTEAVDDDLVKTLLEVGVDELCPCANAVTMDEVNKWHRLGFNVRAWGVSNEDLMKASYGAGVDGMTINAPDVLRAYIEEINA